MAEADRFPRWRVFWRVWYSAEAALGSLPMVAIVPSLTAVGAAIWAVGHPALTIRRGLVVGQRSLGDAVLNGVIGGVVVLCTLVGLVFIVVWVWYRLLGGDRVWEAIYRGRHGAVYFFELRCKKGVGKVNPVHLGEVECWIKTPAGNVRRYAPAEEGWASDPDSAVEVWIETDDGPGRYEVRWYSMREGERRREVARQRVVIDDDEPAVGTAESPWLERRK